VGYLPRPEHSDDVDREKRGGNVDPLCSFVAAAYHRVACCDGRQYFGRRWRRATSAFAAPLLAIALIKALWFVGLDPDRIHFLLVKYPHELQIHFSPGGEQAYRSWDWGLDAPIAGPGSAYALVFDSTDSVALEKDVSGKSVRSMGDHFYLVEVSEDGDLN
jgi:hypothetical protein